VTKFQGYIPVYLADRTIVGYAEVEVQGEKTLINMELSSNGHIAELVKENLDCLFAATFPAHGQGGTFTASAVSLKFHLFLLLDWFVRTCQPGDPRKLAIH